jgi:SAM-dependent methyltransferase
MRNCPICKNLSDNLDDIIKLDLSLVDGICLNDGLTVKKCKLCEFYFSDSNNTQDDYDNYYLSFNNYQQQIYCPDKDNRGSDFIKKNLNDCKINKVIDYGSGNGVLADLLSDKFYVDKFDVGMDVNKNKYDLLILSHVLEHIYDLNNFIKNVSQNINDGGFIYIEIPNADFYEEFINICPLQEINIEHINFFSKYSLNKLLIDNGFYCVKLEDDYFMLKNSKYFVIRGIFRKIVDNKSFEKYVEHGLNQIQSYKFDSLKKYKNIYIYGCGQFLFKIFDKININCNIINIIDDSPCYLGKNIKGIKIINYEEFKNNCKDCDNVLLTTIIHDLKIKEKLSLIDKNINIIELLNL